MLDIDGIGDSDNWVWISFLLSVTDEFIMRHGELAFDVDCIS